MRVSRMLVRAQRAAEETMASTVRIRRQVGETRDEASGRLIPVWDVVYEGPARLRHGNAQPRDVDAAGQQVVERESTLSLPISASGADIGSSSVVRVDDVGEVLRNSPDPGIEGTKFRIAGDHSQTHASARRFPVEVLTHG